LCKALGIHKFKWGKLNNEKFIVIEIPKLKEFPKNEQKTGKELVE